MSKSSNRRKPYNTLVTLIISIMLVILIVGIGVSLVNGNIQYNSIRIKYLDNVIENDEIIELPFNELCVFDINTLFTTIDYELKVIPNPDSIDFDFYVNEKRYSYKQETSLNEGINIDIIDNGFTIKIDKPINGILGSIYRTQNISVPVINYNEPMFQIQIKFSDNSEIKFNIKSDINVKPKSIQLNRQEIVIE